MQPGGELLDLVSSIHRFSEASMLLSCTEMREMAVLACIPTSSVGGPSSPAFAIYGLFDVCYSHRCERMSRCGLICISLVISNVEHILGKMSIQIFCPLKKFFFDAELYELFNPLWILTPSWSYDS